MDENLSKKELLQENKILRIQNKELASALAIYKELYFDKQKECQDYYDQIAADCREADELEIDYCYGMPINDDQSWALAEFKKMLDLLRKKELDCKLTRIIKKKGDMFYA